MNVNSFLIMRDEDDVPCDIGGYMFLAFAGTAVIVTAFIGDHDDLDGTLAYHIEETAVNFDSDLSVFPIPDCYAAREDAQAALDAVASRESQLKEKRKS